MSAEIFTQWPVGGRTHLDVNKLQLHVQEVAAAASALTANTPIADDTLLAGLLHDIGYWVLAQECPTLLNAAVDLAVSTDIPLHAAESQVMGASHAEIGAYLLGVWGLPYPVIEAVAYHHMPQRIAHTDFDVTTAVAIAHSLVPSDDASAFGVSLVPELPLDASYLSSVKAPFDWDEALRRVAQRAESEESSR